MGMSRGPGKWQRAILSALEDNPDGLTLKRIVCVDSDVPLNRSGISARQRAAKMLETRGLCKLLRVWGTNKRGVRSPLVAVFPPGTGLPQNYALTGYEHQVSSGGPAWSDRMVAQRLGVSPGMVSATKKRLSVEAARYGQVQHIGDQA
jgi:hypothetical protein